MEIYYKFFCSDECFIIRLYDIYGGIRRVLTSQALRDVRSTTHCQLLQYKRSCLKLVRQLR